MTQRHPDDYVRAKLAELAESREAYLRRRVYRRGISRAAYYTALQQWDRNHPDQLAFWRDHPSEGTGP